MEYYLQSKITKNYWLEDNNGTTKNINKAFKYSEKEALLMSDRTGRRINIIPVPQPKKILIIGDARHGKDCFGDMICEEYGYKKESSSMAALRIFLFDILKTKYNLPYGSKEEAFEDRINHRDKWFDEITLYNKDDRTRLAKDILKTNNIYVGMRSDLEVNQCKEENTFDVIIGLINYRIGDEDKSSNTLNLFKGCDIIVCNNGTLEDLKQKVIDLKSILT